MESGIFESWSIIELSVCLGKISYHPVITSLYDDICFLWFCQVFLGYRLCFSFGAEECEKISPLNKIKEMGMKRVHLA